MKIIATSDWHIGNLFHGIDRLPEHEHFMAWLKDVIKTQDADALLVAGDIFDNGNPSAAAQELYYSFLDDVTHDNPQLQIIITAGNHDSANRLEAPSALLHRHKIEVRGRVHRQWVQDKCEEDGCNAAGHWEFSTDDLMIPITSRDGKGEAVVLAVPFLRSDVSLDGSYSKGVTALLHQLTDKARGTYPDLPIIMMAHMYAAGAEIREGSSEQILSADRSRCRSANGTIIRIISRAAISTSASISGTRIGRDTRAVFFLCHLPKGTTIMAWTSSPSLRG